jgi:hypothetical protein
MRSQIRMWAVVLTLITCGQVVGGERQYSDTPQQGFLQRLHPAGGWHPYGGGLLHWWDPHCFPRCGAPDDYCRKPLPCVCWPSYPSYYTWGPPEMCCSRQDICQPAKGKSR